MTKIAKKIDLWKAVSIGVLILYVIFMLYPLAKILIQSFQNNDTGSFTLQYFQKFFADSYYFSTLGNSFLIAILTTAITLLIGIPLAYFYNMYEIRGRYFLQLMIILCSMSAPFIGAYSWILLFGRAGVVTKFMSDTLNITLPSIYGFSGIVIVLVTKLFPLVFLYVSGALQNMDNSLLESSMNMGCKGYKRIFKIVIPLCMPSILASALMVFMRALADFGTPLLIGEGYRTFPVEIYKQYVGETTVNHNFAAAISVIAILITAVVFLVQKYLSNKYSFTMNALHPIERKKAKPLANVLIHIFAYGVITISYLPNLYLVYCSFLNTSTTGNMFMGGYSFKSYQQIFETMGDEVKNTIVICGGALVLIVFLAVLIAYLVVRRKNVLNDTIDTLSMIPYIIPGIVVGIAMISGFSQGILVLSGTAVIMIIAMCVRRIPYTIRSSVAILQQIPITVEEAAASLGATKLKTFYKVTIPMMKNGIISGSILSWVSLITELSSSIILYSSATITLNLGVYIMVGRGCDGKACAISTILTVVTVISLLIVKRLSKGKEITM